MLALPIHHEIRHTELQPYPCIGKNLYCLTGHHQSGPFGIVDPIIENDLSCCTVLILGLNQACIAIPEGEFEFQSGTDQRGHQAMMLIDVEEIESELAAESIAAILEILEVVAVPYDAKRIYFAEADPERDSADQPCH